VEIFVICPYLYYQGRLINYLTDNQLSRFMDILIAAVSKIVAIEFKLHFPVSFTKIKSKSFVRSRETSIYKLISILR